jgi:hypothetical protein
MTRIRRTLSALVAVALFAMAFGAASPSQGFVVRESATTDVWFSGASCGDPDYAVLSLPRRARAIHPTEPAVGDPLFSDDGSLVADVTAVRVQGHHVVVSVRGAHAVCDSPANYSETGWATASYSISARYSIDRSPVVFSCGNARTKPRQIVIACGDGNYQLHGMRWSSWGGRLASGRGRTFENDCIPFCAVGHFHSKPARVRLSKPRYCSSIGRWNYTRITIYPRGKRRQRIWLGWICHSGFLAKRAALARVGPFFPVTATVAHSAPKVRSCSNTWGGDVIEAKNMRCRTAHGLVRTWARRYKRDGKVNRRVLRFRCRDRSNSVEGLVVQCKRGHASVTFYANVP